MDGEFTLNEKISNAILIFLLLARLADQYLPWLFGVNTPNLYAGIVYILTAIIVWLNRHRLSALNIDRPCITALIIGGVFYTIYLGKSVGIFVGLTMGLIYWAYKNNHLVFKNPVPYSTGTGLLILLPILLAFIPALLLGPTLKIALDFQLFVTTFLEILLTQLPSIIVEEVLFRGALWAYIRNLGLSEQAAFYISTILFWVAHHKYLSSHNTYFFWIAIPIIALLLGFMTWRSKSLTPSTISHLMFNFVSGLMAKIF